MSFLRNQEPRPLCVCPLVSFPRKQEPTQCPSCASSSPVRLSPPRERPAVPKAPPGVGATVSFLRKQESRKKTRIPTFVAVPRKWPPHEAKLFWTESGSHFSPRIPRFGDTLFDPFRDTLHLFGGMLFPSFGHPPFPSFGGTPPWGNPFPLFWGNSLTRSSQRFFLYHRT